MQLAEVAATADGRYKVYIYADQTAELRDQGRLIAGPVPLFRIGQALADLGLNSSDLISS